MLVRTWTDINEKSVKKLNDLQHTLIRYLFSTPRTCPLPILNFEVGASSSIATIRIDGGLGWIGKREYFLELRIAGKGDVEVDVDNQLIASAKLTDEGTLLTDSFVIASTPEKDNPSQVIEIRAGDAGSSGSLREIRLLQFK